MPFQLRRLVAALLVLAASPAAQSAATLTLTAPDLRALLAADAAQPGPHPWRFAAPIPVLVTPLTHGSWSSESGQPVWRLTLYAPGAKNLNLGFGQFALPPGASLALQGAGGVDPRGPYGADSAAAGQLWTPVIRSDTVELALTLPAGASRSEARIVLTQVGYGFRGFGAKDEVEPKSGKCNIDVACEVGDEWRNEQRAVARFTIAGALLCTGSLVNNTAGDFTPYFLTASHCLPAHALAPTTVYYWNYETSECARRAPNGSLDQTQSGAIMLSTSAGQTFVGSDFVLMQLLQAPSADWKVYYSGWDRRDLAPVGVVGIHHPNGDEKRISFDFDPTQIADYVEEPTDGVTGTHLKVVEWDLGVTEGGSSGSGIWNFEHRLVGTLSGGYSSCDAPKDPDWYGRFEQHWGANDTPLTGLAFWLDPDGTGAEVLDGADPNGIDLSKKPGSAAKSAPASSTVASGALPLLGSLLLLGAALLRRR